MYKVKKNIWKACSNDPIRNFTEEDKEHIRNDSDIRDDLIFWWESNSSDGWWTDANAEFMHSFYEQNEV